MADKDFVVKNGLVVNTSFSANSTQFTLATINATSNGFFANTSQIKIGNSSVNATINSTAFTGDAATVGSNTASTLRTYSDTVGSTAYSNAMSNTLSRNGSYTGNNTFGGTNTVISSNLNVTGTINAVNTTQVNIEDNKINLNTNFTGSPTADAGIRVERGDSADTEILWRESAGSYQAANTWGLTNDGTNYYNLPLTSELTIDAVTTNGASTANDVVLGGLTISGAAQAKSDHLVLYCTTTDATTTEMFLNGTNGRIGLASNTAATFKGDITAFDSANAKAASWSYNCLVANKAGNTAIVGAAHVVKLGDDSGGTWEVYVDADNPNDSLKLQVKGQASSTIKWTASVISSVVS